MNKGFAIDRRDVVKVGSIDRRRELAIDEVVKLKYVKHEEIIAFVPILIASMYACT